MFKSCQTPKVARCKALLQEKTPENKDASLTERLLWLTAVSFETCFKFTHKSQSSQIWTLTVVFHSRHRCPRALQNKALHTLLAWFLVFVAPLIPFGITPVLFSILMEWWPSIAGFVNVLLHLLLTQSTWWTPAFQKTRSQRCGIWKDLPGNRLWFAWHAEFVGTLRLETWEHFWTACNTITSDKYGGWLSQFGFHTIYCLPPRLGHMVPDPQYTGGSKFPIKPSNQGLTTWFFLQSWNFCYEIGKNAQNLQLPLVQLEFHSSDIDSPLILSLLLHGA